MTRKYTEEFFLTPGNGKDLTGEMRCELRCAVPQPHSRAGLESRRDADVRRSRCGEVDGAASCESALEGRYGRGVVFEERDEGAVREGGARFGAATSLPVLHVVVVAVVRR